MKMTNKQNLVHLNSKKFAKCSCAGLMNDHHALANANSNLATKLQPGGFEKEVEKFN